VTLNQALAVLNRFEYTNFSFGGEYVKRFPTEMEYIEAMEVIESHILNAMMEKKEHA
jgi:hypothetical protein